ncbi:MAG: tRNA pseudouridine(55) synthase TruB [Candidatus Peribacteraceae bacterium]|jgi:tRNA pseudouridine55 synthase
MRHGFLLIDKPAGITSHDAVAMVRRTLPETHAGHLGTLDPAATGLLVMGVGRKALKVIELFNGLSKEYEAGVRFGAVSTTYDGEGVIEEVKPPGGWTVPQQVILQRTIADRFIGKIDQVPPSYSAIKVGGERAYRKARQGRSVELAARQVEIISCTILSYAYPDLVLDVTCGSGTYIRSLAHDLGRLLRCGGYLKSLRRTKVGRWSVTDAVPPDKAAWARVIPLKEVLRGFPRRELTSQEFKALGYGQDIAGTTAPGTIAWHEELPVALLEQKGEGVIHARKML